MQLEHSFTVPVTVDEAWRILLDIERIGPCLPGATIESVDGDEFTGSVKVKLGPINLTYKGKAAFVEKDESARRAVIDARGRDARGNGTAKALVTATLAEQDGATTVSVATDLDVTGKPAQFGRGVMVDVGNKLIGQFADCLARTLAGVDDPPVELTSATATGTAPQPATDTAPLPPVGEPDPVAAETATPDSPAPPTGEQQAPTVATRQPGPVDHGDRQAGSRTEGQAGRRNGPRHEAEPINLLESAGPALAKRLAPVAVAGVVVLLAIGRRRRARRG
jgi:carbon monoxide dehydrogenase subunit G